MVYAPPRHKLTVEQYYAMGDAGILGRDDRVELLDGELFEMETVGDDHVGGVISLEFFFGYRLQGRALVSTQNPVRLSDYSEPEPDLVLLRPRPDFYRTAKPRPEDVLLIVEVSHSSLDYDRLEKLPRYAAAGIAELWIVNLIAEQIEVYRDPTASGYATTAIYRRGATLAPAAFPDVVLSVVEIIG